MLRRVCLFLFSFGFSFLSAGVLRGCSEGFCLVLGLFVGGWGFAFLGGIVLGETSKDFCLSCANRSALSQSLRIMSITIFYFLGGQKPHTKYTKVTKGNRERNHGWHGC